MTLEVTGTGHSTMLGNYSGRYRECFDPATGAVTGGTFTLTAANGDKVFGTFSGQARPTDDPTVVTYDDPGVITGGTGRFADAGGTMTTSGLANLATGEYTRDHHRQRVAPDRARRYTSASTSMRTASSVAATSWSRSVPVLRLEEEREPRAVPVGVDLHPAAIAARRAPLDPALSLVGDERRLAAVFVPVVARLDLDLIAMRRPDGCQLWDESRQVVEVGDRREHRFGRCGDVLRVFVLHDPPSVSRARAEPIRPA